MGYGSFVPLLVKAVQELNAENDNLKGQLNDLLLRIEVIEKTVSTKNNSPMTQDRLKANFRKDQTEAKYITLQTFTDDHLQEDSVADKDAMTKNNCRFLIRTLKEVFVINFEDVVCCIADNNYTTIHLADGTKVMASKTLKDFETILYPAHFFRIHSSNIINMNFIKRIHKARHYVVELTNHDILNVARSKQKELLLKLFKCCGK